MRKFGQEAKEFFEFQIEGSDVIYKIPLAPYMPASILLSMKAGDERGEGFEEQFEMLQKYMGDGADDLTVPVATQILQAWAEASQETGATVGESQALSD